MDSLRSHGHMEAALRLAVSVVRTMKQQQLTAQRKWHESQQSGSSGISAAGSSCSSKGINESSSSCKLQHSCRVTACTSRCQGHCTSKSCSTTSVNAPSNMDGWVGHPLDPIGCLFDTLADTSLVSENNRPRTPTYLGKLLLQNFTFKKSILMRNSKIIPNFHC